MIGFFLMGIVSLVRDVRSKKTTFRQWLIEFSKDPIAVLVIFFLITLVNWTYSTDMNYWLERLRLRMLFLFLPFSFYALPKISKRNIQIIFYFLISLLSITSLWIGIQYVLHFQEYQHLISVGKPIPVPRNHIRYNILLAISIIAGIHLWTKNEILRFKWERPLLKFMTIFLFIFIHILAVRSGLVALYLALVCLLINYVLQNKKYISGIVGLSVLIIIPLIAIKNIPSLKNKLSYTVWDNLSREKGKIKGNSDGERITSQLIGIDIFKEHPLLGVGSGDLKNEVKVKYQKKFGDEITPKMPHNQYISILAKNGILGFIVFMFASLYPLFYHKNYKHLFSLGFHVIIFSSYLVENTIENAIGAGIYMFFVILILRQEEEL